MFRPQEDKKIAGPFREYMDKKIMEADSPEFSVDIVPQFGPMKPPEAEPNYTNLSIQVQLQYTVNIWG